MARYAVVTGASRGIGHAVAVSLAKDGTDVLLCFAGNEEKAKETRQACLAAFPDGTFPLCRADVGTKEGCGAILAAAEAFPSLDVLVNCAGITRDGLLIGLSEEDIDRVLSVNLEGAILLCRGAVKRMIRQRSGHIISISSVVGLHGNPGQVNYAAAKAGIVGLTRSLAKEVGRRGITVNAVAPGMIATDMTAAMPQKARDAALAAIPMQREGTPEDVAEAVRFLASDAAGYITGQVLCVDGGMGM